MNPNTHAALRQYQQVKVESEIDGASSHRLVTLLLDGAIARLSKAENALAAGEISARGEAVSETLSIIDNLRASLDMEAGGDIALNLRSLYDYMEGTLVQANMHESADGFREVRELLKEIATAWNQIASQASSAKAPE